MLLFFQKTTNDVNQHKLPFDIETQIKTNNNYSKLKVDSELSSLAQVLNWFESLRSPVISYQIWIECQTALGEAFDNVVIHAHKHLSSRTTVDIGVKILDRLIIIKIWGSKSC